MISALMCLSWKQDRQCTCNATLWRVRVAIVSLRNVIIRPLRVVFVDLLVAVSNVKVKQLVPSTLLSNYKLFRSDVSNINVIFKQGILVMS